MGNLLPPGTLVHVIALRDDKGLLDRDDNVMFAALAQQTGGIGVDGTLAPDVDATLLVRPTSLDRVEIKGTGWDDLSGSSCDADRMPAGTSCTWLGKGTPSAGPIVIDGLLWNRPMKRVVVPDPAQARAIARELSALGGLEAPLQAEVDRAAMAVNAVWSLYAAWGGDGGYAERLGFGHGGFGTGGSTDTATIGDTIGTTHLMPEVDLSAQLAGPLAACGDAHATIEIDLTLDEIVDVAVAHAGAQQHVPRGCGVEHARRGATCRGALARSRRSLAATQALPGRERPGVVRGSPLHVRMPTCGASATSPITMRTSPSAYASARPRRAPSASRSITGCTSGATRAAASESAASSAVRLWNSIARSPSVAQ